MPDFYLSIKNVSVHTLNCTAAPRLPPSPVQLYHFMFKMKSSCPQNSVTWYIPHIYSLGTLDHNVFLYMVGYLLFIFSGSVSLFLLTVSTSGYSINLTLFFTIMFLSSKLISGSSSSSLSSSTYNIVNYSTVVFTLVVPLLKLVFTDASSSCFMLLLLVQVPFFTLLSHTW